MHRRDVLNSRDNVESMTQSLFPIFLLLSSLSDISASILAFPEALSQHLLGILLTGSQSPKPLSFKLDLSLDLALSHIRHTLLTARECEGQAGLAKASLVAGNSSVSMALGQRGGEDNQSPKSSTGAGRSFPKSIMYLFPSVPSGEREGRREGRRYGGREEDAEWQERQRQGECAAHTQTQRVGATDRQTRKHREQQRDRRHKETETVKEERHRERKRGGDDTHTEKQR